MPDIVKENPASMPRTFRLSEETFNAFSRISEDMGGNKDDTLKQLLAAYEYIQTKEAVPELAPSVDEFDRHINVLKRLFVNAVDECAAARQTVGAEFETLLRSKEQIILDLQAQVDKYKTAQKTAITERDEYEKKAREAQVESVRISQELDAKIKALETSVSEKLDFNNALQYTNSELKKKVEIMEAEHEAYQDLQKTCKAVEKDLENLTAENKSLKAELKDAKETQSLELQRAILDHDRQLLTKDQAIQELKAKHQAELEEMQKKYMAEIERLNHIAPNTGAEASK